MPETPPVIVREWNSLDFDSYAKTLGHSGIDASTGIEVRGMLAYNASCKACQAAFGSPPNRLRVGRDRAAIKDGKGL